MIKQLKRLAACCVLALTALSLNSCFQDLDIEPFDGLNSELVYGDPANYINVLAKLYAGLATTGNQGPAGDGDIAGIDEGFSSYLRILWNLQEVTTDMAVLGWNDPGVPELNYMDITPTNDWVEGMYYRIFFQITLCNDFIRRTSTATLEDRGFSAEDIAMITQFQNEARVLRAMSYYHALDFFGNVPFVTEDDAPGAFFPNQISRTELFDYVESELLAVEGNLTPAPNPTYGRIDQATAWMLLAKLYLNAEVYTGTDRSADCVTYIKQVIDVGYTLEDDYTHLFLADNHTANGVIFPVTFDGLRTQTWGGTTYLVHAPVGGSMDADEFGINDGWQGLRGTPQLVDFFVANPGDTTNTLNDSRWLFYTDGQTYNIEELPTFTDGYAVAKWRNITSAGEPGSHANIGDHVDNDYPVFRLADAYLMYAEATLRSGTGDQGLALNYVNMIRERAFGDNSQNFASLDLDVILDERARELYWEGHRRTDLIRYGQFTGTSRLWVFKGQDVNGTSIPAHMDLFPIPAADLVANQNLTQNPGY